MPIHRKHTNRRGGVMAGCLIALGVVVVLVVIGAVIVAMNWRGWAANVTEQGFAQIIDQAELSQADADAMKAEVATLMQDFKDKKVSLEDLARVLEETAESPVLPAASIMFVERAYITESDLSDEEKAEGSKQLSRFMRGLFDKSISKTKLDDVTEPIHYQHGSGGKQPIAINANNLNIELKNPEDVTTEELNTFLANCKAAADDAGVPPDRYEVDMAAEFSAAIDRALGRAPALPPADDATGGEPGDVSDEDQGGEG